MGSSESSGCCVGERNEESKGDPHTPRNQQRPVLEPIQFPGRPASVISDAPETERSIASQGYGFSRPNGTGFGRPYGGGALSARAQEGSPHSTPSLELQKGRTSLAGAPRVLGQVIDEDAIDTRPPLQGPTSGNVPAEPDDEAIEDDNLEVSRWRSRMRTVLNGFNQMELADALAEGSSYKLERQQDIDLLQKVRERLRMVRSRNSVANERRAREAAELQESQERAKAQQKPPQRPPLEKPAPAPDLEDIRSARRRGDNGKKPSTVEDAPNAPRASPSSSSSANIADAATDEAEDVAKWGRKRASTTHESDPQASAANVRAAEEKKSAAAAASNGQEAAPEAQQQAEQPVAAQPSTGKKKKRNGQAGNKNAPRAG